MITLSGYTITKPFYADTKINWFRGYQNDDHTPVIIKTMSTEYPNPKDIARFQHDYEINKELQLTCSIKPRQLKSYNNGMISIFENVEGELLKNIIANKKINLLTFLKIAMQLANALGELQQHNVIHKDIKPANIIVHLETGQIKIIDFSLSSKIEHNSQFIVNKSFYEGTLAYMSPEQTGRMNCAVDYRTDFYSLGVSFYEMLMGWLPFQSTDAMELVHCHIAKLPISPHTLNPDIPEPISDIVMKLLAKNAEDRYQSAYGLKMDLQTCWHELSTHKTINPFRLGQQDITDKFQLPKKIYGRTRQLSVLTDFLFYTRQGQAAVVLICGEVGIGKTALVYELQKTLMNQPIFFITGQFDSAKQNLPYSAIIHALRELILQLLTESSTQLVQWREKLRIHLDRHAPALIQLIPELEMLIGPQQPTTELDSSNHFIELFKRIIRPLAQPSHPLIMFLDDLHWADSASLSLLSQVISDLESGALLLIGGYRNIPQLTESHPLYYLLEEFHQANYRFEQIRLTPLKLEPINQLIADTLHCSVSYAQPLAELVLNKTEGNPFFVNEFLTTLYQEGHLYFDIEHQRWVWNIKPILEMNMTDNVVALTGIRLQKLSTSTQEVLKLAASIGLQFDIKTLAMLYQHSEEATTADLWEAVEENLVIPQGEVYQLLYGAVEDDGKNLDLVWIRYRFVHDHVQQAAYALLSAQQKQVLHYQLGQYLRENTVPGHLEKRLFDIVNHLNLSIKLIKSQTERDDLAHLNLAVGKKAKLAGSYDSALNYFQMGLSLLSENSWQRQYHLTLALHVQAIEVAYLSGHNDQADRLFTRVLQSANNLLDRVKVYELKILFYISQNQMSAALETGLQVLQLLDIKMSPPTEDWSRLFVSLQQTLGYHQIEQLMNLPPMTDKRKLAALRILVHISSSAYLTAPQLYPLICFTQIKLCLKYGNSALSAYSYASYSLLLCKTLGDIEAGYRFGQLALNMLERFESKEMTAKVLMLVNAGVRHWKEHARQTLTPLLTAIKTGLENNDVEYGCYAAMFYSFYSFLTGSELEKVNELYQHYLVLMVKLNQPFQSYYIQLWRQLAWNLQGVTSQPTRLCNDNFDEDTLVPVFLKDNNFAALFSIHFAKSLLCYLFEEHQEALKYAQLAEKYMESNNTFLHYSVFIFYYSLILIKNYQKTATNQAIYLDKIRRNQAKMRHWARQAPSNYQHKYDLVSAEQARVLGHIPQAMTAYEQAIQGAKTQGYIQEEALANELAAQFYANIGIRKVAQTYLTDAHYAYLKWGATAKTRALEAAHPFLASHNNRLEAEMNSTSTVATSTSFLLQGNNNFDLMTVMKASQTISGEIVLEQLIKKLLHIVIENAGAQRGLLILEKQGQLFIEAEAQAGKSVENHQTFNSEKLKLNDHIVLQSVALESINDEDLSCVVPVAMINYVVRTNNHLVLNDAMHDGMFTGNPYIKRCQPKSVLCSPLLNKGHLMGVLYLENNLITNAFTAERLNILKLLSTQIAISIENALFYAKLEQARTAADMANRAKSTFLMNMSHELRTPLNAIIGYSEIIQEDAQDMGYDEILLDLTKIQTAGKQLLEIISNVLDISKIEADKMGLNLEVFEVKKLVNDVITVIEPSIGNNQLQVNCPEDLGTLHADQTKVQQVLLNLLSNAVKFTRQGTITFTITRHQAKPESNNPGDWLHFEVADTGIGMTPEQIEHVFEAFHQVDNSTTRQYGGTGLGLTISDHFCRMMGGKISVTSKVGQGSVFTVQFPAVVDIHKSPHDNVNHDPHSAKFLARPNLLPLARI